ncbi:MAG: HIT family protein [Candidatus Brocadiaceae bacterium]|jgi:diadenosine tetraphosphate (Ap4A) HIT family hydrolase
MEIRPASDEDRARREATTRRVLALAQEGICPTCRNLATGEVYPTHEPRTFYEDDRLWCFLEAHPRNPGHTIVLLKRHYEDISELSAEAGAAVTKTILAAVGALKRVLGAEKVYLCTMCDGRRNHLHFQLIPRLPGDEVQGSRLFVKERALLGECRDVVERLRAEMSELER